MDLGAPELLIILVIALLIFGSNKLPKLARSLGQASKEFKAGTAEGWVDDKVKSHITPAEATAPTTTPAPAPAEVTPVPAAEPPNGAAPSATGTGSSAQ
jgi:sec-independent protein translocase protein TatA